MIEEIINFENDIEKESSLSPPTGLNILASFDENGNPQLQFGIYQNNKIIEADFLENDKAFFSNCAKRYQYAIGIHHNKRFVRQIETFSSFVIGYTLNNGKIIEESGWEDKIDEYFRKAIIYSQDFVSNSNLINSFEFFIKRQLPDDLEQLNKKIDEFNSKKENKKKISLGNIDRVFCYCEGYDIEILQKAYSKCVWDLGALGFSDDLTTYADKKPFLYHYTAPFGINHITTSFQNEIIKSFITKLKKSAFPKPLPIFIDKEELNNEVLNLYEKSGKKITYSQIIEKLFKEHPDRKDIQNYYLLFAQVEGKAGLKIRDFDFVPFFRYDFPARIEDIFDNIPYESISSIFDFEKKIVKELFDNCLVKEDDEKGEKRFSSYYFYEDPFAKTDNTYSLITKYRRAFFDFIYKSRTQAITGLMLKDIILSGVFDTLKDYEYRVKNKQKEERIKRLLNIYFSINHLFDKQNINFNQKSNEFNMANRTKELITTVDKMVSNNEQHIESDEEFAFDAGQLIYYLISQSEASNKSHSLLLTYLQKSDFTLLKEKIVDDVRRYGHAISFNNQKFNKLVSEVMGYELKDGVNKFTAFILAGYFSKNVLYSKS